MSRKSLRDVAREINTKKLSRRDRQFDEMEKRLLKKFKNAERITKNSYYSEPQHLINRGWSIDHVTRDAILTYVMGIPRATLEERHNA